MTPQDFRHLLQPVIDAVAGRPVDHALAEHLNAALPGDGPLVAEVEAACHAAIAAGWMCSQGEGNRKFGRILQPAPETRDLSVDVVDLRDVVGPHHTHPNGEICLVMPVDPSARFDKKGRGWCVYPPGSGHRPTVTDGRALVLYLLPEGKIAFTGQY